MDDGWLEIIGKKCRAVSSQGKCDKSRAGAIIFNEEKIFCAGYSRPQDMSKNCVTHGHVMMRGICIRTRHAEQVALSIFINKPECLSQEDYFIYLISPPCVTCAKLLIKYRFKKLYYERDFKNTEGLKFLKEKDIEIIKCITFVIGEGGTGVFKSK